ERQNKMRVQSWLAEIALPVLAFEHAGRWNRGLYYHALGRYLLCEAQGRACEVRNLRGGSAVQLPVTGPIDAAAWSCDGQWLALASHQVIKIFEFPTGLEIDSFTHPDPIQCARFSQKEKLLVIGGVKTARVRNVAEKSFTTPSLDHPKGVTAVVFNRDGNLLA